VVVIIFLVQKLEHSKNKMVGHLSELPWFHGISSAGVSLCHALKEAMISVLIECKNQESALAVTLASLVNGAVEGLVAEVVILDRGSSDGEWMLLIEPGARPLLGWIDHFGQHMAAGRQAARMRPSRQYRLPFLQRFFRHRLSALEHGVLMPKRQAIANAKTGQSLESLGRGVAMTRLNCEIVPASVLAFQ
jgi:hypothetical protein